MTDESARRSYDEHDTWMHCNDRGKHNIRSTPMSVPTGTIHPSHCTMLTTYDTRCCFPLVCLFLMVYRFVHLSLYTTQHMYHVCHYICLCRMILYPMYSGIHILDELSDSSVSYCLHRRGMMLFAPLRDPIMQYDIISYLSAWTPSRALAPDELPIGCRLFKS